MTCAQGLLRLLWGDPKLECYGTGYDLCAGALALTLGGGPKLECYGTEHQTPVSHVFGGLQ